MESKQGMFFGNGKVKFWDAAKQLAVVFNPVSGGSVFHVPGGYNAFLGLK